MKEFMTGRGLRLFISLAFIIALSVTTSAAQQKTWVAGTITSANTKIEKINVGDIEDHTISLLEDEGVNVSTGEHNFLDGSAWSSIGQYDLVAGNGAHQGYGKQVLNGDSVFLKWEGHVTTTLSPEGMPMVTFEGTFSWTNGTGQFENIQGGGVYKGRYISRIIWTSEWEGDYSIGPATTEK